MESYTDETNNISYTYDSDGLRASKTVNGAKTIYQYVNSALYYQCTYTTNGAIDKELYFFYDSYGNLASIRCFTEGKEYTYYTVTNMQGDVLGIYDAAGTNVASYEYDTWGNIISTTDTSPIGIAELNPIRYRGYYYDSETELYYLQSRYYDAQIGRFLNSDNQLSTGSMTGMNLFAYCGNNPVNRIDPIGEAWWHWALGAAVVVGCAVATVVTAGGFAAAASAVCMVGSGVAAATTASTIAAGAFIGSATIYGMAVVSAASTSSSMKEFNDQGNWGTVASTAGGAVLGAGSAYVGARGSMTSQATAKSKVASKIKNEIIDLPRIGSALQTDPYHAFPNIVDNYASYATKSPISNGTLYQLQGSLNGVNGRFEWIVQNQQVTHRMFVKGGTINGIPIMP